MNSFKSQNSAELSFLGFTPYQWLVLIACWLGWGFDVFDALLFNYVARLCIPSLLGSGHDSSQEITRWTGLITSVLLVGWAIGGILFGKITDQIGRSKTLLLTMLTYALATAACAAAPNIWLLILFRFIASLGIGGEWAAGASLVAETVPEKKRVPAGALLYTAAPLGLFLATFVTDLFTIRIPIIANNSDLSWRLVFLTGLLPAALAFVIRLKVHEPEKWLQRKHKSQIRDLFGTDLIKNTLGGLIITSIALITWWSCNAFVPVIASFLIHDVQPEPELYQIPFMKAHLITQMTTTLNLGGLIGTLCTIPAAIYLGRKSMFLLYFLLSGISIFVTFQPAASPEFRIYSMFFVGFFVFGIFGAFPFYLPELFPTHLRATGSGFCYNIGRIITAAGPFLVGQIAASTKSSSEILDIVSWVGIVPFVGILFILLGICTETKDQELA